MAFDSKNYEWSRVSCQIGGRVITGLRGIRYKRMKEKEYLYATGNEPSDIMEGNISYEGTVTLLQDEVERLIGTAGSVGGHLDNLAELTIVVSYKRPNGGPVVTDTLTGVQFTEMQKEIKQNDKHMEIALPIMFLGLKLQTT